MAVHASAHNDDDDFEHERERTSSFLSSSSRVYQRVASSVPTRTTRAAAKHIRYPEEEVIELMSDEEDLKPVPHARSALQNVDMSLNNFQGSSVGRNGRGLKRSRPSSTDDETLSCSPPVAKKNGRLEDEYEEERGGGGEYTLHGRNNDNDFMAADDIGGGLTGPNKSADGPFCCG